MTGLVVDLDQHSILAVVAELVETLLRLYDSEVCFVFLETP